MRMIDIKRQQRQAIRDGRNRDRQLQARVFEAHRARIQQIKEGLISLGLTVGEPACHPNTTALHLWFTVPIFGLGAQSELLFAAAGAVDRDGNGRWVFIEPCDAD